MSISVAAGFSLRRHRLKTCATNELQGLAPKYLIAKVNEFLKKERLVNIEGIRKQQMHLVSYGVIIS